ncbi:hypothetical protein EQV77_17500 [Halobacillus fulvus]|nr:hypothetical protein EQV77_17500 [Halobacillus fulvus]
MEQRKFEFLTYAIQHVENRIALMDQKASILMAIMGGFYVLIVSLLKDFVGLFQTGDTGILLKISAYIFLIIGLLITFIVVYYLLMTIRPRKGMIHKMELDRMPIQRPIFWFNNGATEINTYQPRMDQLDEVDMYENLKVAHFTGLQLVKRKYFYYRKSISWMNVLIVYNSVGVIGFLVVSMVGLFN